MASLFPAFLLSAINRYMRQRHQEFQQFRAIFDDQPFHNLRQERFLLLAKTARFIIPIAVVVNSLRVLAEIPIASAMDQEIIYAMVSNISLIGMYILFARRKMAEAIWIITLLAYGVILLNAWVAGIPYLPLGYLAVVPIIGTTLLSLRLTLALSGINLLALTVFRFAATDTMTWANYADWVVYLALMGLILLLYTYIHVRLMADHTRVVAVEERTAAARDMMQYISHDFRTPLSGIYTSLHLLGRASDTTQRQRYQERIQMYAQRMERLIDEVMILTRLDKNDEYRTEESHLDTLLGGVLDAVRPLADAKNIKIKFDPKSDLPILCLNVGDCELALHHVLENAITYTPAGGTVSLVVRSGDPVTVTVRDTGIGITPEEKQRIFERFYRGDGARSSQSGGAGLGLPIVQRVMERHGGSVIIASEPGLGTIVALRFPLPRTTGLKPLPA